MIISTCLISSGSSTSSAFPLISVIAVGKFKVKNLIKKSKYRLDSEVISYNFTFFKSIRLDDFLSVFYYARTFNLKGKKSKES
jgi:hypothetical protein